MFFKFISKFVYLQQLVGSVVSFLPPVLLHNIGKYIAIKKAFLLTSLDGIKGDYCEFGVFTGASLIYAIKSSRKFDDTKTHQNIRFFGFDSFEGFGKLSKKDQHPFYLDNNFKTSFSFVYKRVIKACKKNQKAYLIKGCFSDTLNKKIFSYTYGQKLFIVTYLANLFFCFYKSHTE